MTISLRQQPSRPDHPPDEPAIRVEGLCKSYRRRVVLDGVSFEVGAGEVFGILGPNGTGKTTAVEIIQGLRSRDRGVVRVLGHDPARERGRLRGRVGAQLQSSALPDRLRAGEALRLFARLAGNVVDPARLAEEWGIAHLDRTAFGSLSGGEQQRVFVALALVSRPEVVFLDELTQGLDPNARRDTWAMIDRLRAQNVAVVLVTHDMSEAERLCDRIAILCASKIRACGTPATVVADVGGVVRTSFTCRDSAVLAGLECVDGVQEVRHDGRRVDVTGDASSPVTLSAELARRGVVPTDLAVTRPSLHDVYVALTEGLT